MVDVETYSFMTMKPKHKVVRAASIPEGLVQSGKEKRTKSCPR